MKWRREASEGEDGGKYFTTVCMHVVTTPHQPMWKALGQRRYLLQFIINLSFLVGDLLHLYTQPRATGAAALDSDTLQRK